MRTRSTRTLALAVLLTGCQGPAGSQAGPPRGPQGRPPAASLAGTAWKLATLPGFALRGDVSSTATFGADGALSGSDGCNRYRGRWTASGSSLSLTPGAATQMACPEPVMRQAAAFTIALAATRSYAVDAGQLVLSGAGGERVATLVSLPVATLQGTPWSAIMVNNGKQAVTSLVQGSEISARFAADGTLTGNAGCNDYTTTYEATGDTIRIAPARTTRKMCPDPVMQQERNYLAALTTATTYRLGEDTLELRSATGALQASFRLGGSRAPRPPS